MKENLKHTFKHSKAFIIERISLMAGIVSSNFISSGRGRESY